MFNYRRKLPAFHERNIEDILKRFKLWKKFEDGELKCIICECVITNDNFGCILLSKEGTVNVACSNPECLEKVYDVIN